MTRGSRDQTSSVQTPVKICRKSCSFKLDTFFTGHRCLVGMASRRCTSSAKPLLELFHPARRRLASAKSNQLSRTTTTTTAVDFSRNVSTATPQFSEMEVDGKSRPRWAFTPPAMTAPVRSRLPRRDEPWKVNEDPKKLDEFYVRLLGTGGEKLLTDETKWLAVTHKSFDHGRRGFNDRIAFLGMP